MKNKLENYFSKFSLSHFSLVKQLLIVFGVLTFIFITVIMPLINYNTNQIIAKQMYSTLESTQTELRINGGAPSIYQKGRHINHIYYYSRNDQFTYVGFERAELSQVLYRNVFGNDLDNIKKDDEHKTREGYRNYLGTTYYYRIFYTGNTLYEEKTNGMTFNSDYLISVVTSNYSDAFLKSITTQIVYIQYGFLGVMAVVLVLWVISLIKPLNNIKYYVDGIKNNKETTLDINRQDEIGIVGNAIVEMNQEIKKQQKAKEEMIHNISHDLKTPIALIKNYTQAVKDDVYPYGDKESTLDVIIENADRLEHKVKSLLYLNRLDYVESEELSFEPFDMKQLIEHTILQMQSLHDLKIELHLQKVMYIGKEDHWRVVIENIIDNASRYARSLIKITLTQEQLIIYNDGEHLDENKIDDLFDPYVKGVKGQFGLGLSIVAKTCEMYGYQVTARNEEVGVSFLFTKK